MVGKGGKMSDKFPTGEEKETKPQKVNNPHYTEGPIGAFLYKRNYP